MATPQREPIAIIGSACRLPGSSDTPSKLWELLKSPRDLLKKVPADRFDSSAFHHPDPSHHGTSNCQESYFLDENVSKFDGSFFNIQPAQTEAIDPQQRLLMETVYDSLVAGGQTIEALKGSSTAVYVGQMCDDWAQLSGRDWEILHTYTATGTSRSIVSNRISYFFDWHGPSMTIDTACSSSMVCLHHAVQVLRNCESRVAIAAGINLILSPGMYIVESKLNMLSPTGRSRMWDADANGYARGEGIASVVLKTLSDAIADGDHIECIIRETGVNQDGRTVGMTMPSGKAQADLIQTTYARAGLDINDPKDRPQFFHAHGTGTPTGDPQESEAISNSFFRSGKVTDTLYVGSLKTIIGHTEGTAGLASIIGTSQALQHGIIPPNMHFNKLHDRVKPFYTHLKVPTEATNWPSPVPGQPRRASVNSFGFGGTNAHAILESYEAPRLNKQMVVPAFTPLIVSAASKNSLRVMLSELRDFLVTKPDTNMRDLAYTLHTRRTTLQFRKVISGIDVQEVIDRIDFILGEDETAAGISTRYPAVPTPKVLGVFTGQGAQWPRMGAKLIEESPFASERLAELDQALSSLPKEDRPRWPLEAQILADPSLSRLSEALVSQTLCTAVQIVLFDMITQAGVKLDVVVGHSSGEIGAAYAAGFISAKDAIRIAYYRGAYATLAQSPNGAKGAMIAIGTSYEDALEFCELEDFEGRVQVAARNASESITLSGDEDAIEEAVQIFQDERKFARRLKVDTAYHSHHMQPCAAPYLAALKKCNMTIGEGSGPTWYSSVSEGEAMTKEKLSPQYWVDNMTQAVLFEPAVTAAAEKAGPFDLALEIAPHPALKGPALQTLEAVSGSKVPYSGVLSRGKNDIVEFALAIGFTWMQLGAGSVDFESFEKTVSGVGHPKSLMTDLPKYPFDHARSHMMLTRLTGGHAYANSPPNPLIGRRCVDRETTQEIQWRNFLRVDEVSWLSGHRLQGLTVFPATGYIAMAVEAMAILAGGKPIGLISLEDFVIGHAMTIPEGLVGLECLIILKIIRSLDDELCCEFTCSSGLPWDASASMLLNAKATITIAFLEPSPDTLPSVQTEEDLTLADREVDVDRFYSHLTRLGYNYSGPFRAVTSIRRQKGFATGTLEDRSDGKWEDQLIIHPCWLDTALQTSLVAYSHPHDERLWALHVPTSVRSILINPYFTRLGGQSKQHVLGFQAIAQQTRTGQLSCDADVLAGEDRSHTFVQMESCKMKPFSPPTPESDAPLFSKFDYELAIPNGEAAVGSDRSFPADQAAVLLGTERMGFFYCRRLLQEITPEERANTLPHYKHLLNWAEHVVGRVSSGKHPNVPQEAVYDTHETIKAMIQQWPTASDVRLLAAVGENIAEQVRQKGSILESMMEDDLLHRFYRDSTGLEKANAWIGRLVAQITHRYPHLCILEIGAGTGGTTDSILTALDGAFSSYTFTDVSAGFFERAQERFKVWADRMVFKTYDMEKSPVEQGFVEGTYDLVIASNALHATGQLDEMMANARALLKPGGYLIPLEITSNDFLGIGTTMSGLPGWWAGAGHDERRLNGPLLTLKEWDKLTRAHGFGGVETATPQVHQLLPYSVFACQAVDEQLSALRNPLSQGSADLTASLASTDLIIIAGSTPESRSLADQVCLLLGEGQGQTQRYEKISCLTSLEELTEQNLLISSSVLCLTDLDEPFLKERSASKLVSLRTLWRRSESILWVSRGIRDDNPYAAMILGLGRAMKSEYPNINLQMLDVDVVDAKTPQILAEALIRIEILGMYKETNATGDEFLWSLEPEMVYENNQLLIPRLYPSKEANNRYNTYRRTIHTAIDPSKQIVALEPSEDSYGLSSVSPLRVPTFAAFPKGRKTVQVSHSLLQMIKVHNAGYFMLCTGTDTATGQHLIALSDVAESPAPTLAEWAIPVLSNSTEAILSLSAYILAKSIIAVVLPAGRVLIHEVDTVLGNAITEEAERSGVKVWFSSSVKGNKMKNCVFVHRNLPARLISQLLPSNISLFINMAQAPGAEEVGEIIARSLPPQTQINRPSDFFRNETLTFPGASTECIHEAIETAWQASQEMSSSFENEISTVLLQDIGSHSTIGEPLSVVDWNVPSVEISLKPIDTGNIFRADGTYLLVGLSGELGQSLCQWMVEHGAKNVVLTSRKPKVSPAFIKRIERLGATATFMILDITSRDSLRSCYEEICRTMPPVIGVANGALILEDCLFDNLSWESFDRQVAPKVDGSRLLDELFYTTKLDFFVLFTSLGNIIGNTGQGSYVAANQYMVALAQQRKKRGVPGSTIAISSLLGIGYVEHSQTFDPVYFTSIGSYRNVSEQDYLQIFAEGVLCGKPGNPENSEIATGLIPTYDDGTNKNYRSQFHRDPKFVHFLMEKPEAQVVGGSTALVPVRVRLAGVTNKEEAMMVIKESFISRLKGILQIPQDGLVDKAVTLVEHGIDSIMSVEIRTWFLKELDIDIPVLLILNATATIDELIDNLMNTISPETSWVTWDKPALTNGDLPLTNEIRTSQY
ncbi:hypothetical protein BGZ57DRAFT_958474 [Hyaloscypha finlandica]|nr:hypothetical protein BGZ57DRAFT_958474 [Hyaloscypha finlandica]